MSVLCGYRHGYICTNLAIDGTSLRLPDGGTVIVLFCDQHREPILALARKLEEDARVVDPAVAFADDVH